MPLIACGFLLALPLLTNGSIPAGLTILTDSYLWVLSHWYLLSVSFGESFRFGSRTGLSYTNLLANTGLSRSTEHNLHLFGLCSFPFHCFFVCSWVSFPGICSLKGPVFIAGIEIIVLFLSAQHNGGPILSKEFKRSLLRPRLYRADTMPREVSNPWRHGAVSFHKIYQTYLPRELLSSREVLCSTWYQSLARCHFFNWTLCGSLKSRRASLVPLILNLSLIVQAICHPFRNRLSCCAFCSSM